jgi:hypothetical protein
MHWVPENEKLFSQQIVITRFKSDRHHHLLWFPIHTYMQLSLHVRVSHALPRLTDSVPAPPAASSLLATPLHNPSR